VKASAVDSAVLSHRSIIHQFRRTILNAPVTEAPTNYVTSDFIEKKVLKIKG
jgi:hypothetical protein